MISNLIIPYNVYMLNACCSRLFSRFPLATFTINQITYNMEDASEYIRKMGSFHTPTQFECHFSRIHWEMKIVRSNRIWNGKLWHRLLPHDITYFYGFPTRTQIDTSARWIQHKRKCKHITGIIWLDLCHFVIASSLPTFL